MFSQLNSQLNLNKTQRHWIFVSQEPPAREGREDNNLNVSIMQSIRSFFPDTLRLPLYKKKKTLVCSDSYVAGFRRSFPLIIKT